MKSTITTPLILASFLTFAATADAKKSGDLKQAATAVAAAADRQDNAEMQTMLHKNFVSHFVIKGAPGENTMNRDAYLGLLRDKKIGGDTRKVTVLTADESDRLGFVRSRIVGAKAFFDVQQTFVRTQGGWQLLSESVVFQPRKS